MESKRLVPAQIEQLGLIHVQFQCQTSTGHPDTVFESDVTTALHCKYNCANYPFSVHTAMTMSN